uniref:Tensin 4 n=1 Tax=Bubo bubo TaxID=30461 RepID=A0A8C0EG57_BUBBB
MSSPGGAARCFSLESGTNRAAAGGNTRRSPQVSASTGAVMPAGGSVRSDVTASNSSSLGARQHCRGSLAWWLWSNQPLLSLTKGSVGPWGLPAEPGVLSWAQQPCRASKPEPKLIAKEQRHVFPAELSYRTRLKRCISNVLLFPPADIKYIEMTPGRAPCPELLQGSPSPSATPFSRSPQGNGFLPQKGLLRGNYSTSGSVVFSSPPGPASPRPGALSCAASPAPTVPGRQHLLRPQHPRHLPGLRQFAEAYARGEGPAEEQLGLPALHDSTHSLHTDDADAHAAACHSTDCPSPASPLGSPCPPSPRSHSGEAFGLSPPQPRAGCSTKANTSPSQKGQASSCPPSILNSAADIPVLLVNGCLEQGDVSSGLAKVPPTSVTQTPPPSCSPASRSPAGLDAVRSLAGPLRAGQPTMKFVMDTSKYWFKPSITRDQAIQLLKDKEPGTFVVRDSTSYRGSFGLAMKVPVSPSGSDESSDLVRHFLIESSAKGVHLKGASEELYFGKDGAIARSSPGSPRSWFQKPLEAAGGAWDTAPARLCAVPAVCNVLYLNSVNMETLTGAPAIQKAISSTFELETLPTPTLVHFRVTEQGVTLTDVQRKVFFRRHYPLAAIRFCGTDPQSRKIFGFVAKSQTDSENLCHLFAEYDTVQSASPVIDLLCKLLPGP